MGLHTPVYIVFLIKKFNLIVALKVNLRFNLIKLNPSSLEGERMESNFNRHLGSKLRMRRLSLGLTQTKVAQAINVTFQQIQKYEKGTNGISSLRIMQLANFLKVPVVFFFEDFPLYQGSNTDVDASLGEKKEVDLNYSFLAKLFSSISDQQKSKILQVLKNTRILEKTG